MSLISLTRTSGFRKAGAALALLGACFIAPMARADVIYSNPGDVTVFANQSIGFTIDDKQYTVALNYYGDPSQPYIFGGNTGYVEIASYPFVNKLPENEVIDNSDSFIDVAAFFNQGPWAGGGDGYVGLYFQAGDGTSHYGWVQLAYDNVAHSITVKDRAYESTPGTAISTFDGSALPEPSSMMLCGTGVVLLGAAIRRRRQAARAEEAAQRR